MVKNSCSVNIEVPKRTNYSLVPVSIGEEQCVPNYCWGPGVRSHFIIHYVISGKGIFYCGPNKFTIQQGQIFVIFPGMIVKYQADAKEPWHYTWINFYGEEAKEILDQLHISVNNPIFTVKNGEKLLTVVRNMPTERTADLLSNLKFSSGLYDFMSLLAENICIIDNNENSYLTTAKRYIEAHYFEDISVDQVAAYIGISRKYLYAVFKSGMGISPKDYLINYRIKRAKEFLSDKNLPIGNIAYSVGYKDSLTFSKMFKKKTGFSPSGYRAKR